MSRAGAGWRPGPNRERPPTTRTATGYARPVLRLLLASASPARLSTLRQAGIDPVVQVSDVDEDAVLAAAREQARSAGRDLTPAQAVGALARAKAEAVVADAIPAVDSPAVGLVIGCDSMLEFAGEIIGKPHTADVARERWRAMRGRSAVLHTGHWLIDLRDESQQAVGGVSAATVWFADVSDAEIDAYVATGEPLQVAGGFTVDGLAGPFIERTEGDVHGIIGLSLPLLRHLLANFDVTIPDLWSPALTRR